MCLSGADDRFSSSALRRANRTQDRPQKPMVCPTGDACPTGMKSLLLGVGDGRRLVDLGQCTVRLAVQVNAPLRQRGIDELLTTGEFMEVLNRQQLRFRELQGRALLLQALFFLAQGFEVISGQE